MRTLILEVVLGCPNFLPLQFLGRSLKEKYGEMSPRLWKKPCQKWTANFCSPLSIFGEAPWAAPGVLWKKAPRAIRAMRGKTLENRTISTVLWVHKKLPQSTVKLVLPSNESYESKTGCNRTLATVLWVPLTQPRHLNQNISKWHLSSHGAVQTALSLRKSPMSVIFPTAILLCPQTPRVGDAPEQFKSRYV